MDTKDLIIYQKTLPQREAVYTDFPEQLNTEIKEYLCSQNISQLYCHQAQMFEEAMKRQNIVITTSTASGKTLSFLLPVLQDILDNPLTRAIFIYPTKALASDQYRAIQPYLEYFGENKIAAGVYDGDTPVSERSRIRKSANIILTNPEMINGAFLPNHSKYGFDFIFSNLKYIVIDELHTYRGAFGSHLANVFRRLGRVCAYYHANPQYLCSSATIANPVELAEEICNQKFVQVWRDGSLAAERSYLFVQPPKILGKDNKYYGQEQATTVAAEMIPLLIEQGTSFIAFAKSRRNVEVVLKEARDKLETESFFGKNLMDKISGYRGGYTPLERKEIENKMINGELGGLISTNALELGIDIGKIDATVLIGYPGTRASFWQQTGRAGRSKRAASSYLILEDQPFDQYIAVNPDWLFEGGSENAVVDKNNLLIQLSHIRAAAAEIPLTLNDIQIFPALGETIPILLRAGELNSQNGKYAWAGSSFPAGDFGLRNIDKAKYKLINKETNKEITQMDELQAFREIHKGAVYMHDGVQYEVLQLDLESRTAYAMPFLGDYYTMPNSNTQIQVLHEIMEKEYARLKIGFGDVNVEDSIHMYKKLQFHNHQNLGNEQLEEPLFKAFDTESTWLKLPENVVRAYRRLLQLDPRSGIVRNDHFEGICYAILNAAMMVTMTEKEDIGTTVSMNAFSKDAEMGESVHLYIYDKYVGGLGYAEKIYEVVEEIIQNAITMVGGCQCEDGCAACIGDYRLDKKMVLWGLRSLLEELPIPHGIKLATYAVKPVKKKQFLFTELPEKWAEFCAFLVENGNSLASFLSAIPRVEVKENLFTLVVTNAFYKEWVLEANNQKSILNIISFYTEAPVNLQLAVSVEETEQDSRQIAEKLQKRYQDLAE